MKKANVVNSANTVDDFNVIASDVNVAKKVSTNVSKDANVTSEKTVKVQTVNGCKRVQNSLKNRVAILVNELQTTSHGKEYLNLSGCNIADVTVENIKNIYSNIIFDNGKKQFFKFVKVTEKNVLLKSDVLLQYDAKSINFELAYNEKNRKYLPILNSDKILFLCNKIEYTIKIVETLQYSEILTRIKSYKSAKMLFENREQKAIEKTQKAQKVDFSKLSLDELIAIKKAESEKNLILFDEEKKVLDEDVANGAMNIDEYNENLKLLTTAYKLQSAM